MFPRSSLFSYFANKMSQGWICVTTYNFPIYISGSSLARRVPSRSRSPSTPTGSEEGREGSAACYPNLSRDLRTWKNHSGKQGEPASANQTWLHSHPDQNHHKERREHHQSEYFSLYIIWPSILNITTSAAHVLGSFFPQFVYTLTIRLLQSGLFECGRNRQFFSSRIIR